MGGLNRFYGRPTSPSASSKTLLNDLVSNSKSFWNKLKRLYNSRQQTQNNISKGQLKQHFEELFKDKPNQENNDETMQELDDDFLYDISEGELEDIIFNSEITDEDILKSVKTLKRGKKTVV